MELLVVGAPTHAFGLSREGTREEHESAESSGFISRLMSGGLGTDAYVSLAAQQYFVYSALESIADDALVIRVVIKTRTTAKDDVARELARMNLPVNFYTQWYWKCDLHNLLHFLSLRADSHAQYEIRAYAEIIYQAVQRWVPLTAEAYEDYIAGGLRLSRQGAEVVRRLLAEEEVSQETSNLSPREWKELMTALGRPTGS